MLLVNYQQQNKFKSEHKKTQALFYFFFCSLQLSKALFNQDYLLTSLHKRTYNSNAKSLSCYQFAFLYTNPGQSKRVKVELAEKEIYDFKGRA